MNSPCVVHVSPLPPRRCGVAEYTAALAGAMEAATCCGSAFFVRLICDGEADADCSENCIRMDPSDSSAVKEVAEAVNRLTPGSILLQHEFKLYGGNDGDNVLAFLKHVNAPVVSTLHTVSTSLSESRQRILREIVGRSARVVVFSGRARRILAEVYAADGEKVRVIPHGVPDVPFTPPGAVELPDVPRRGVTFITCGLLRPGKGIEDVIPAFAILKQTSAEFTYLVCGGDHPRNRDAMTYRRQLVEAVERHGLEENVFFLDHFLDWPTMLHAIQACDVGICAYTTAQQSSSGVLALTLSCGRPVVATDFQYAREVVNEHNGILVPIGNVEHLATALEALMVNPLRRMQMAAASYDCTRPWVWREVAQQHIHLLNEVNARRAAGVRRLPGFKGMQNK